MRAFASIAFLLAAIKTYAGGVEADTAKYNFFSEEENTPIVETNEHNPENLPSRWGFAIMAEPGKIIGLDSWARDWLKKDKHFALSGELRYTPQPNDGDHFAEDYNYPTFAVGFKYSFNHGTELQRVTDHGPSKLGDVATLYGRMIRPFYRTRRFEIAYYIGTGIGYSHKKYNKTDQVNNEFIGSIWNIYFTGGIQATYKMGREWAIVGGIDFSHHSNGALYRPNKGTNYLGPFVGMAFTPSAEKRNLNNEPIIKPIDYPKGIFLELAAGVGAKTLLEDWQNTQYHMKPTDSKYRTTSFPVYGCISLQTSLMYRYTRRWVTGIGVDVFYSDYADKIARLDYEHGKKDEKHSPWSVGMAIKHEAYYGRFSARMAIGAYLYRHMGYYARHTEGPQWLYERIGLFYSFPTLGNAAVGFSVTAHVAKADFPELVISYPISL